jgi:hypothetical protein
LFGSFTQARLAQSHRERERRSILGLLRYRGFRLSKHCSQLCKPLSHCHGRSKTRPWHTWNCGMLDWKRSRCLSLLKSPRHHSNLLGLFGVMHDCISSPQACKSTIWLGSSTRMLSTLCLSRPARA